MTKEQYDFFRCGIRAAKDVNVDPIRMAIEIEKKYGLQARMEFECGIALSVPMYAKCFTTSKAKMHNNKYDYSADYIARKDREVQSVEAIPVLNKVKK